jgi:hypothetical protein
MNTIKHQNFILIKILLFLPETVFKFEYKYGITECMKSYGCVSEQAGSY